MTQPVHATLIALWRAGAWRGALLRGPSGAGKSSLALRCIEAGWRLVADDRTLVWCSGGLAYGRAHPNIEGLVEARGLGVLPVAYLDRAEIRLCVDLAENVTGVERTPEPRSIELAGIATPLFTLWAHDAAAPAKLALALSEALARVATPLGLPPGQAYQAPRADRARTAARDAGASKRNR